MRLLRLFRKSSPPRIRPFIYRGGDVSRDVLEEALDFFISLEPENPSAPDYLEQYEENERAHKGSVDMAHAAIRRFGEQIYPRTLEAMQQVFYEILAMEKYSYNRVAQSVVYATLNSHWDGIGPWER